MPAPKEIKVSKRGSHDELLVLGVCREKLLIS